MDIERFFKSNFAPKTASDSADELRQSGVESGRASFTVRCAYIRGKDDLLLAVSAALQFPWYFSHNWDSFDECLRDLSWLCSSDVELLFDDASKIFDLPHDDFATLFSILEHASTPRAKTNGEDDATRRLFCTFVDSEENVVAARQRLDR